MKNLEELIKRAKIDKYIYCVTNDMCNIIKLKITQIVPQFGIVRCRMDGASNTINIHTNKQAELIFLTYKDAQSYLNKNKENK